ncbi:hypothetical protein [Stenotrophomonas koreensis]|uniref:hypothetical protein n=1 Tax=Stenotrophomonas koreensis TaxID=266128 RepID=UPI000A4FED37|nr:hypothetical protein [Stenotrophomonas koreensis]
MAAVTAAVAVGAGMAYSANRQGAAAKKAGNAKANAAQATIDQNQAMYDQGMELAQPYYDAGGSALAQMQALNSGDFSSFNESPDFQFARDQGLQSLDRSAAARGGLYSGGADADRMAFASGLASQNYGNYYGRLANLAQMGQNQSQYMGNLGQNFGNQYANAMGIKGDAKAMAASATAGAQAGYGNALASAAGTYMGMGGGGGSMGGMNNLTGMFQGATNRKSGYGG